MGPEKECEVPVRPTAERQPPHEECQRATADLFTEIERLASFRRRVGGEENSKEVAEDVPGTSMPLSEFLREHVNDLEHAVSMLRQERQELQSLLFEQ